MSNLISILTAVFSFLSTIILALIGWGMKSQMAELRAEFQTGLAQAEIRFFELVNGKYVRKEILDLRLDGFHCSRCRNFEAVSK